MPSTTSSQGTITGATGIAYKMQQSNVNNALRIPTPVAGIISSTPSNGTGQGTQASALTLSVTTPLACSNVYLLCMSGNGAIASGSLVITVNFSDGSSQVFNNYTTYNWCTTGSSGLAYYTILTPQYNRANILQTACGTNAPGLCPNFAEMNLQLNAANYQKNVSSISINFQVFYSQSFNVYAVGAKNACYSIIQFAPAPAQPLIPIPQLTGVPAEPVLQVHLQHPEVPVIFM